MAYDLCGTEPKSVTFQGLKSVHRHLRCDRTRRTEGDRQVPLPPPADKYGCSARSRSQRQTIDEVVDRRHFLLAREHFTCVVETRLPVVRNRHGVKTDHQVWNGEILVLPLSESGSNIDMLMGCVIWDEIHLSQAPFGRLASS